MDTHVINSSDQTVPSNAAAERAVLGAILIDAEAIIKVTPIIHPEDFSLDKHKWIFQAILSLHDARVAIDKLTVVSELKRDDKLNDIGGAEFIDALINATPTAANVEQYARIVERFAVQRRLINAAKQIAGMASDGREDIDSIIDNAEQLIFNIGHRRISRDLKPVRIPMDQYLDRLEFILEHTDETIGVPTGFHEIDNHLGGLQPSDLIIIAGRPGSGKTAFALSLVLNAAVLHKKRIALFSLEMSEEQLVQRFVASMGNINSQTMRLGTLEESDVYRITNAAGELSEMPVFIDDSVALTPMDIRAKARRLHSEFGLDMIVVDYLQLMTVRGHSENRVQEVSEISRQLKELARELRIPVVALSQLLRTVEDREDHRPQLSDLRGSGSLEQDSDIVVLILRQKTYYPTLEMWNAKYPNIEYPDDLTEILLAKNRHGPTRDFRLRFIEDQVKFDNITNTKKL